MLEQVLLITLKACVFLRISMTFRFSLTPIAIPHLLASLRADKKSIANQAGKNLTHTVKMASYSLPEGNTDHSATASTRSLETPEHLRMQGGNPGYEYARAGSRAKNQNPGDANAAMRHNTYWKSAQPS